MDNGNNNLLLDDVEKITLFDMRNNKELAVIRRDGVDTVNSDIVIKIKFKE